MLRAEVMGRGWVRGGWLALLVVALCSCSAEPGAKPGANPEAEGGEGPFARRFLPFDPAWRPFAEVPSEPQESPEMVIWEVSEYPAETQPSEAQRRAADDLLGRYV